MSDPGKFSLSSPVTRTRLLTLLLVGVVGGALALASVPIASVLEASPARDRQVHACLYTWYGTPDGPAGHWPLRAYQRGPDPSAWAPNGTTMTVTRFGVDGDALVLQGSASTTGQTLALAYEVPTSRLHPRHARTYFKAEVATTRPADNLTLHVRVSNETYAFSLLNASAVPGTFHTVRRVLTLAVTPVPDPGPDAIWLAQVATAPGNYQIAVRALNLSRWTHYNEDYHAYQDPGTGFWYNDPPGHAGTYKATEHNVWYDGTPWPEIPAYGFYDHSHWHEPPFVGGNATSYGIYDSLNETVIEAQLRLMEKAGIDTCLIMHPWAISVAEIILAVADRVQSNLTFAYYGDNAPDRVGAVMASIASHPKYLHVDGRAVYYCGPTGLLEEPYAVYEQRFNALHEQWDVFLVGDMYSSPYLRKEEMLNVLDGWYYYDTSAFFRHGWGDPAVRAYQPDGSYRYGYGHLDSLYGSIGALVHGYDKVYAATVIPGTDNTCVHDFTGQPLADGRPGTINLRAGGRTFNDTWEAAIQADADWVNIVSWNELHEGTEIEPTVENGTFYVELCRTWADRFHAL